MELEAAELVWQKRLSKWLGCSPFELHSHDSAEVEKWSALLRAQDEENERRMHKNKTRKPENQIPEVDL